MICFYCKTQMITLSRKDNRYNQSPLCNNKPCIMYEDHRLITTWSCNQLTYNDEDTNLVSRLLRDGYSQRKASQKTGVPRSTIQGWIKQNKI